MQFKNRGGFGLQTIAMMLNGKFDPANIPPMDYTSLYPKLLERINKTDKYKNNPLELIDIYDPKKLHTIKKKWYMVPLGLNDAELEEYFLTGEDPRLKDEKIEVDKTSMMLPKEEKTTQLTELITQPNNQPIETSEVSADVVKTAALPANVNPKTGLTYIDDALLSNEEKAMRLRQKGMTA